MKRSFNLFTIIVLAAFAILVGYNIITYKSSGRYNIDLPEEISQASEDDELVAKVIGNTIYIRFDHKDYTQQYNRLLIDGEDITRIGVDGDNISIKSDNSSLEGLSREEFRDRFGIWIDVVKRIK